MKKYFGLLGAVLFCTVCAVISFLNWRGADLTISQHIALETYSIVLFAVVGGFSALLIAYNLLFYLPQKWNFGIIYKIIAATISICLVGVCLLPHTSGIVADVHQFCALAIVCLFVAFCVDVTFETWRRIGRGGKIILSAVFVVAVVALFIAVPRAEFFSANIFIFESLLVGLFLITMICLTFSNPTKTKEKK